MTTAANQKSITGEQAAALVDLTWRRLQMIAREPGGPEQNPDGSYPPKEFGKWLKRRHLQGLGIADDGKVYDYDAERARLTHHQANVENLKERTLSGDLVPRESLVMYWQSLLGAFRAKMLAIPIKVAHVALAANTLVEVEDAVRACVNEALNELNVDGIPPTHGRSARASTRSGETAAAAKGERVGGPESPAKPRGKPGVGSVEH